MTNRSEGAKAKPSKSQPQAKPPAADGPSAVVGTGASAGGLDALKEFFKAMPPDSGMAFVVVQHLEPAHESQMAEILSKYSAMSVAPAEDGMPVRANCVYTIPASKYLSIRAGRLRLTEPPERHGMRMAIDFFFHSLADDQQEKAVCIILSGSGSDGTHGLREVRSAGGMCMAQDPKTAQFGIMPQSAIDTGLVDYVLPPDRMPAALVAYVRHGHTATAEPPETAGAAPPDDLESILSLLRSRTNSDYRCYKMGTVVRRIERRMGIKQVAGMADYLKLLRKAPHELTQLAKDMLIGVTSFFRDAEAFDDLRNLAIIPLVGGKSPDSPLRVWVPGCATGEEAYSVAILLLEALAAAGKTNAIQVFASDVDEAALETARAGIYVDSIAADVSAERLERFFIRKDGRYQVGRQLREAVVFARQNLIADPPFSKMDLITCRNVLIYFQGEAQRKVLSLFSFALNVGGYLFLGKSEAFADPRELFETVSKPRRIYRLAKSNRHPIDLPVFSGAGRPVGVPTDRAPAPRSAADLAILNQQALLEHFGAAVVLVEPKGRILHFYGQTEKYLGHSTGQPSLNVLDMAGGSLATKLRRAMAQAIAAGAAVTIEQVPVSRKGSPSVNVTVTPVGGRDGEGKILAIILEDAPLTANPRRSARNILDDESALAPLEAENRALRAELDETNQEHESASEELKAANEEVMSMNEELQSTNEELETSTEELQSVNEELNTVNNQLTEKVGELTGANNDLANLAAATEIATIFLDTELRIKQFTPRATELLNLIAPDVGRPLSHITQNFDGKSLAAVVAGVIKDLTPIEKEVQIPDGRWYTMRILPYRTLDNRIDGAVVTFSDVTRLKEVESHLRYEKTYAEQIAQTVRHPLLVLDDQLQVMAANRAFHETFRVEPGQSKGRKIYDLGNGQWNIAQLRALLEDVIPKKAAVEDFRVEHVFQDIGRKIMLVSGRRIHPTGDMPERLLLTIEDITQREAATAELHRLADGLARSNTELEQFAYVVSHDLQEPLRMITGFLDLLAKRLGVPLEEKSQEYMSFVSEGAQRMQAMIKDLLDFSRVGRDQTKRAMVDLAEPLKRALESLQSRIEQSGAKITCDPLPTVSGVSTQLARLFQNLIGNAIKFRGDKPPEIHIAASQSGPFWQIAVADKGIGIEMKSAERAFQVFQRLHTREKYEGTGIGLAICKRIVEQHGGKIWLESQVGKGTTFYFTLSKDGGPEQLKEDQCEDQCVAGGR